MASRDYARAPGRLQVEFRSPSALLVAYSVNLSRGGMFIECDDEMPPEGALLDLDITLPDRTIITLQAMVTWQRHEADDGGPRGVGLQFDEVEEGLSELAALGAIVDELVLDYSGITILVQCVDAQDRKTLLRRLKAIIGTVEVVFADDDSVACNLVGPDTDLIVIDADEDESAALATLRCAHHKHETPVIALTGHQPTREKMASEGADEVLANPPTSTLLRKTVLHLLSRPRRVPPA